MSIDNNLSTNSLKQEMKEHIITLWMIDKIVEVHTWRGYNYFIKVKCIGETKIRQVTHSVYVKNYTESRTFIDRNSISVNEEEDSEEKLIEEGLR